MKINELSKASGVNLETIRYYEKVGILPEPQRSANGYRVYGSAALELLRFIRNCRALGFSLDEIKYLNQLKSLPQKSCTADQMIVQHLAKVDEKIAQLIEIKHFLNQLVNVEEHDVENCKAISGLKAQIAIEHQGE